MAEQARAESNPDLALELYLTVLEEDPSNLGAIYWAATLLESAGDLNSARALCERGLHIEPNQIGFLLRLGQVAARADDAFLAHRAFDRVAQLDPNVGGVDALLAEQYFLMGRIGEAVASYDRAIVREPNNAALRSSRLFIYNFADLLNEEELFAEHRRWGISVATPATPLPDRRAGTRDMNQPLRVGFIGADFRHHPVAFFVEPLFRELDRSAFRCHVFDTNRGAPDATTERLRALADQWTSAAAMDDKALIGAVESQGIDILIDLAGHTDGHRLSALASKPAPVQATWLGCLGSTGVDAVGFRLTDGFLDPVGMTDRLHTEKLIRLRHHACLQIPAGCPEVNALPALTQGYVTFGAINQWPKATESMKGRWAQILKAVPNSRLLVVARGGAYESMAGYIRDQFTVRGVEESRIIVRPHGAMEKFWRNLQDIDINLDTFPYAGGTTTLHSLWMGVPMITLLGRTAFARNSVGPLTAAGLAELIADTGEAYVANAVQLATDVHRLAEMRAGLRQTLRASDLMNSSLFARDMERALRAMWEDQRDASESAAAVQGRNKGH